MSDTQINPIADICTMTISNVRGKVVYRFSTIVNNKEVFMQGLDMNETFARLERKCVELCSRN